MFPTARSWCLQIIAHLLSFWSAVQQCHISEGTRSMRRALLPWAKTEEADPAASRRGGEHHSTHDAGAPSPRQPPASAQGVPRLELRGEGGREGLRARWRPSHCPLPTAVRGKARETEKKWAFCWFWKRLKQWMKEWTRPTSEIEREGRKLQKKEREGKSFCSFSTSLGRSPKRKQKAHGRRALGKCATRDQVS